MSTAAHTPGPWRLSEKWEPSIRGDGNPAFWGYFVTGSNENGGSILPTLGFVQNFPNNIHANARLIAAAPDMLAALREIEEMADGRADVDDGIPNEAMRMLVIVRAAIAKAEGRS